MCTLSWVTQPGELEIFFSRDERHERMPARPPTARTSHGVRYLAPEDGDHGGTWLSVSETGLCLALLNGEARHEEASTNGTPVSRGLLVSQLAHCRPDELSDELALIALERFKPFALVALAPDHEPLGFAWDGDCRRRLALDPRLPMLTSSSWRPAEVRAARVSALRTRLGSAPVSAALLEAFHRSHLPEAGPLSVCMHRDDASTVSLSHVRLTAGEVVFGYSEGPACRAGGLRSTTQIPCVPSSVLQRTQRQRPGAAQIAIAAGFSSPAGRR